MVTWPWLVRSSRRHHRLVNALEFATALSVLGFLALAYTFTTLPLRLCLLISAGFSVPYVGLDMLRRRLCTNRLAQMPPQ